MKYFNLIVCLAIVVFFTTCKKKVKCDNAELCVKNIGSDIIYYAWGSSFMQTLYRQARKPAPL